MNPLLYKITDKDRRTHDGFLWPEPKGEWVTASGEGQLCGPGWLHAYNSSLVAMLRNPVDGAYDESTLRLWTMEWEGKRLDDTPSVLKCGVTRARLFEEIEPPKLSIRERCCAAIEIARAVRTVPIPPIPAWDEWATAYILGDATAAAAWARAAEAAARAAAAKPLDLHAIIERAVAAERARVGGSR